MADLNTGFGINTTKSTEGPGFAIAEYLQQKNIPPQVLLALAIGLWLVWTVSRHRSFYNDLVSTHPYNRRIYLNNPREIKTTERTDKDQPKPPHSWWFGHLALFRRTRRSLPARTHPHAIILAIQQRFNLPPVFYLDWYPVFAPMIIVTDPTVATQLTNAENLPRHSVVQDVMGELVGRHSVFWSQGSEWKHLRSTLTPAMSTTYLLGRVPRMLHHMLIFEDVVADLAKTGETFPILGRLISMTIDVIGDLMLDLRLAAQSEKEFDPIVREFRAAMKFTWQGLNFWEKYVNLPGLRWHSRKLDNLLASEIRKRWETRAFDSPEMEAGVDFFLKKYDEEETAKTENGLEKSFLKACVDKYVYLCVLSPC